MKCTRIRPVEPHPPKESWPAPIATPRSAAAAEWAASALARDRSCSVAVVVPGLESVRARIERIFTEVMHPELFLDPSVPRRFNLSLGTPAFELPGCCSGARCARMRSPGDSGASTSARCSARPSSPVRASNASPRALADSHLRELGAVEVGLDRVCDVIARFCPDLSERLNQDPSAAAARLPDLPPGRGHFSRVLEALGWPGDRARTSAEFQTLTRWQALLGEFAALEIVRPSMSSLEALACLRELTAHGYLPASGRAGAGADSGPARDLRPSVRSHVGDGPER